jgi:DNA-binding winged helix-turn-helix (wHTH) protein
VNLHSEKPLLIGNWRADSSINQLSRGCEIVKLEPRTMRLLMYMAERQGDVISIPEILQGVWPDVIVSAESVYQAIATLRRALGDKPTDPSYIVTAPRLGYRLIAAVSIWVEPTKPIEAIMPVAPPTPPADTQIKRASAPVRPFLSRRILIACAAGVALSLVALQYWPPHSQARTWLATTTVTFDNLATPGQEGTAGIGLIPASYAGLDWTCTGNPRCTVVNGSTYGANPSGYQSAVISKPNVLSTGYGDGYVASNIRITRTGGGVFTLNQAYFTSPWYDELFVAVVGENASGTFGNITFTLGAAGIPKLQRFDWNNLTSVFITASGGHPNPAHKAIAIPLLAIDDLTYTAVESSAASAAQP